MDKNLAAQVERTGREALQIFEKTADINKVPFPGSWTMGQAAEHVYKFSSMTVKVLESGSTPPDRDPHEKAKPIEDLFLDTTNKLKSPDFIEPSEGPKEKKPLYDGIQKAVNGIRDIAATEDLDLLCIKGEMPVFGLLTKYEWIHFFVAHLQRHIRQFKKISRSLSELAEAAAGIETSSSK